MASDLLKKIGTGVYAGIDEFLFNLPDFVLSKVNNDAYKRFKEYRKGEGATAEKIGDIASILGDIAMIPVGGAGLAKIGGKLGLKGAKTAAKAAAKKTIPGVIQAGVKAVPKLGAGGTIIKNAGIGAARSAADTWARSIINPDAEEKDALRQNLSTSIALGGLGGGVAGGLGWLRRVSKGGDMAPVSAKISDELKEANAMDTLQEMGIGRGYRKNLNKMMKDASEEYIMADAQDIAQTAKKIWNEAAEKGLDFPDLVKEAKEKLSKDYKKIYAAAAENHDSIKKAVQGSVVDSLTENGKLAPEKLKGARWKEVLGSVYNTDADTQEKINELFGEVAEKVKNATTAESLTGIGDYVNNRLKQIVPSIPEKEAGSIAKGIRDSVFDAIETNGGESLRSVNKQYRHLQTILDSLAFEAKREMGRNYSNIADSFASQIVSGNVINNLISGALMGGGALATGSDWKTAALATGAGIGGGTLVQAIARKSLSNAISSLNKGGRAAAAELLDRGALDKLAQIANSKTGKLFSDAAAASGTAIAKTNKDIPQSQQQSDEQRRIMANELFDQRLKEKREQIDAYNRAFPDFAIDPQEAMRILESQREAWTSKEGTLARIGDKNLTKLTQAADLLRAGATGQEAYYALRQLGLSEKETEKALEKIAGYKSKTFRDNFIRQLLDEQASKTLSPESYQMIAGGLL